MSEFDTHPPAATLFPLPEAVATMRADLALEAVKATMRLAMELFAAELREMNVLNELAACYRVLRRETE